MKRTMSLLLLLGVLLLSVGSVFSQDKRLPPVYLNGPAFSFCEALDHKTTNTATTYGFLEFRWIISSDCNNGWNWFLGNTVVIKGWKSTKIYWIDWSKIEDAGAKISTWQSNPFASPLTIEYDTDSMKIISITSHQFAQKTKETPPNEALVPPRD